MGALPSGTVTFLLTDVEGSASLWTSRPEVMTAGISRHYEILDEVISAHRGVRPVEQGEGDSVVGAFARPSDAVAAAIEAQTRLLAELDWLPVRMAVHTGEAILRGVDNYVGPTIIACARIRACGHGRQILVSDATAGLVGGVFSLVELGSVRLKGIVAPERVWQVVGPGLPDEFPSLHGLDAAPHNLPVPLTSLVGRQRELGAVGKVVERCRLTTLTGAGGCGKTRLALAVVTESVAEYPGGSWWIELASTSTHEQVANAVAAALRIPLVAGADQVDQVTNHLRQLGPAVLVLDNAEHVLDAVARLATAVLERCLEVKVVVTSREQLGVPGEEVWRIPSLDAAEAAALFTERAKSAGGDRVLDRGLVAGICERLDGIPLAIELAAARARSLPLERITAELAHVFRILTGGARTAVVRQQTMLASITWSYDLLDPVEQTVLRRLSVFNAPFLLATAEQIVAHATVVSAADVVDVITRLVDKSLVQFDPAAARYRLLEAVRQFGFDRLGDSAEEESARARHAEFYAGYAKRIGERMRGFVIPGDVRSDLPDVFAALRWSYGASPVDAYRICAMNRQARLMIGYLDEMAEQLDWLVARDGRDAPAEWAAAMVNLTQEAITIFGRVDLVGHLPPYASSIDPNDTDTVFWQMYADGFDAMFTADTSKLEALVLAAEQGSNATRKIAAASALAMIAAYIGRLELAETALTNLRNCLRELDQPLTCVTTGPGHAAALWVALWSGRLSEAQSYIHAELPEHAFALFISAVPMALVGFAAGDEEVHDITGRWLDRPAAPLMSGMAMWADMLRAPTTMRPNDLSTLRRWLDFILQLVPTSAASLIVPIAAAVLAGGDVAAVRVMAESFRACSELLNEPALHRAAHQHISAMLGHAEADQATTAAAARRLISTADQEGYVLMQIDGLELLAVSTTLPHDTNATILAAAHAARDRIGYRGRWPNLATDVITATNTARRDYSAAFEHGTTLNLLDVCSLVTSLDHPGR